MYEKVERVKRVYVTLWDSDNITRSDNHGVGLFEKYEGTKLARFKEVALIDPNFIAFYSEDSTLVFEDMEIKVTKNNKANMSDEEIEIRGY